MKLKLGKQFDLYLAVAILAASLCLSAFGFASIQKIEKKDKSALQFEISEGETTYNIIHKNSCIGFARTFLTVDENTYLKVVSSINLALGKSKDTYGLSFDALFNPLDQLTKGGLKLNARQFSLDLESVNTNPIQATLNAKFGAKRVRKTIKFPGPILLKKEDGMLSFQHSQFDALNVPLLKFGANTPLPNPQISLKEVPQQELCSDGTRKYYNAGPIVSNLSTQLGPLLNLSKLGVAKNKGHK